MPTLPESISSAIHDHLMANLPPKQAEFRKLVAQCMSRSKPMKDAVAALKFFEQAHGQDKLGLRTGQVRAGLEREMGLNESP